MQWDTAEMDSARGRPGDRGQALVWIAGVALMASAVCVVTVGISAHVVAAARGDAVADVTALAAAGAGRGAAEEVATGNGAELVSVLERDDGAAEVVVVSDGRRAVAAARVGDRSVP